MIKILLMAVSALAFTTQIANAEVMILKKSEADMSAEEVNRSRYEKEVRSMDRESDLIAYQLLNKKPHPSTVKPGDELQVTLIRVRR